MLSRLGTPLRDLNGLPRPITRPPINLPDLDDRAIEAETREAQSRVRVIRLGRDSWEQIAKTQSFDAWKAVGAALAIGKAHALKVTGGAAWGRNYSREFNLWIRQHGFDRMPAATRSVAVELHENAEAITAWRNTLPERQRKRLVHPLSVTRRWRASLAYGNGKCPQDWKREAAAAFRHFIACVENLPTDEARPLWQAVERRSREAGARPYAPVS